MQMSDFVGEGRSSAVVPWISEQTPNVATCGAYCEIACETFPRANAESEATVVEDNLFPSRVSKRLYLDDCTSFSSSMLLVICLPIVFKLQKWTSTAVNMLTKNSMALKRTYFFHGLDIVAG